MEYSEGVTSNNTELFILKQPDRKSIILSCCDTQAAEILAASECSLMYISLKIYAVVGTSWARVQSISWANVCASGPGRSVHRRSVIGAGSTQEEGAVGGCHMGGVTSSSVTWTPVMHCDEVRLPNPRKTKVLSVTLDESSTTAAPGDLGEGERAAAARAHAALHLWDIDDGETPGSSTTANGL